MNETGKISITANGKTYQLVEGSVIPDFLQTLNLAPKRVAIEHNRNALTPTEMLEQTLNDGDNLEIVKVVAGG
ncbi:MAG: sulfur carrier protein ThiS [Opitutae bacterium]